VEIRNHLLSEASRIESPNQNDRISDQDLSLIVIHNISLPPNEFGGQGIHQLFTNSLDPEEHAYYAGIAHLRVSAHLLIRRDGAVFQYVPFNRRAWHAGISTYEGRKDCNDFSIGIELEGTDFQPFEPVQYLKLREILDVLIETYPGLSRERIVGHEHIAAGRKTDPGPFFAWSELMLPVPTPES
jgi:AmpD protein